MAQPVARVEVVSEKLYEFTYTDPYRWMEDWRSDELREWVTAQGEHSREYLENLPRRNELLARITGLSNAGPAAGDFRGAGGRFFYLRRDPGEGVPKLVMRPSLAEPEKVLINPNSLGGSVHTALDWFYPSPDGKLLIYGLSRGGSEESLLHIMEVDSGEVLPDRISRTRFPNVNWNEDSKSFFYRRLREQSPGSLETDRYKNAQVHLHILGTDPDQDEVIISRGLNPGLEFAPEDFPNIATLPGCPWIFALIIHGVQNEITLFAAPTSDEIKDPAKTPWVKIADVEDAVTGFTARGDTIYLRTHKGALRYKVISTSLKNPDLSKAQVVFPASKAVIEDVLLAGDYLVSKDLEGGIGGLRRVSLAGGDPETIPLPFEGTILGVANEPGKPELLVQLTSWTVSPRVFHFNVNQPELQDTGWLEPSPVDFSQVEAHEVMAPSKDGTLVPLSIIHKKGLKKDGKNPTLLAGYGSYGLIAYPPTFIPNLLAWYELGGVFAVAHMRGGGEYGKEWHLAGQKLNKQNTVDDFIAGAEYLIKNGYTNPQCLAGEGTSAGGIPSGNSLVQRPDLWAVIVMRVAVTNFLRFEHSENGPPNVPEFGTTSHREGFEALKIMDSYHKVKDGEKYPAVLLTTGLNDPRVVVWQATKMAARLQAASTSGKPVLLRVESQGGHGMGSTRSQMDEELADKLAFLLEQFNC